MKKTAGILSLLLVVGLLFGGQSALASGLGQTDIVIEFERNSYYKENVTLAPERTYRLPEQSILRVEKGATMTIQGDLQIWGTLKNYGTIIVTTSKVNDPQRDKNKIDAIGHLSNKGRLENYGTILVRDTSLENLPGAVLVNSGEIRLEGGQKDTTLFWNRSLNTGTGTLGGEIYNEKKGVITLANTEGIGFQGQKGSLLDNKGTFQMVSGAQARGTIAGNPAVLYQPAAA